jgi:hypothetical protein
MRAVTVHKSTCCQSQFLVYLVFNPQARIGIAQAFVAIKMSRVKTRVEPDLREDKFSIGIPTSQQTQQQNLRGGYAK